MYISPEAKKWIWIACGIAPFVMPGWRGELVPVQHDAILVESARHAAGDVFGVSRTGDIPGEEWHAQYMGNDAAAFFCLLNLRSFATRVVPPDYVAHIPPGTDLLPQRADAYFEVRTSWRWPWWWPGGGVDWTLRER